MTLVGGSVYGDPNMSPVVRPGFEPVRARPPLPRAESPGGLDGRITPELAAQLVRRIFQAGLHLSSASSMLDAGPTSDRVATALDELDQLIREIRLAVFDSRVSPGGDGPRR